MPDLWHAGNSAKFLSPLQTGSNIWWKSPRKHYTKPPHAVDEFRKAELIEYPPGPSVQLRVEGPPAGNNAHRPF